MNTLTQQQQAAIEHLNEWRVGALFMEPGTGKTRAAMTLVNSTPCTDCFWIGPLRTYPTIQAEMARWGGMKMPTSCWGVESLSNSDRIYMNLLNAVEASKVPFIVVDESLKIKNAEAKRTRRLLEIGKRAEWKLVLNGTPVSRNLLDMWPQMEFLSPKILGMSLTEYKNTFTKWTRVTKRIGCRSYTKEYVTGMENVDYLHSLIRHYVYECDLRLNITQKWHNVPYCITDESRERYNDIKEDYLSDETLEWRNNNIFLAMTTEMQVAYTIDEGKMEAVSRLLQDMPQDETIVFCRFIVAQEECRKRWPKVTVLSMQKESLGLNLQAYRHTIFFDRVWDYALLLQASRRTYRTGQEQDCHYYELTGNVGLEHMMAENIKKKVSMSEYLKKITKEELYERL
jgi:SNF2 family DNA or RNA helicase